MQLSEHELSSLLALSEDDLYLEIDRQLMPPGFRIDLRGIDVKVESGKSWFEEWRTRIRDRICTPTARASLDRAIEAPGSGTLLIAIADMIAGIVVGVSPVTVAALVVKLGLGRFCGQAVPGAG
jgi:hypothetical protein